MEGLTAPMRHIALIACLGLSACVSSQNASMPTRRTPQETLPPMKTFSSVPAPHASRSNSEIAQDFLDLAFQMESGRPVPRMTRFEEPVTLRITGAPPISLGPDLAALLHRLRSEAGIDIQRVTSGEANITIEVMPRAKLQALVPQAACFVAPRVSSWAEYRRARRSTQVDWTTLTSRDKVAIFLPGDVSPQEVRDCLHEELAQALGPLNDLYRLPDSVFNDDNFHTVLTGFDMLILRVYYAPELQNGMTRPQVAARLPGLLARLNPAGQRAPTHQSAMTSRAWIDAIEAALGPGASPARRRNAAGQAVQIALDNGWHDNRLAFSLFAMGRLTLSEDGEQALSAFLQAGQIFSNDPNTRIQAAHVGMHLAAFALSTGQADVALQLVNTNLGPAMKGQNAALLATLLMIKAEALELQGRMSEARTVRLDSYGWARYGFGSEQEVRAREQEIAALSPRGRT